MYKRIKNKLQIQNKLEKEKKTSFEQLLEQKERKKLRKK